MKEEEQEEGGGWEVSAQGGTNKYLKTLPPKSHELTDNLKWCEVK